MGGLAYDDTGTGPPIVFLHGVTANRRHWGPVVERLSDRYRCINVDLLGHGESPDADAYDLFTQVGAILPFLDELDLDAPVVAGHSFGGFIATFLATAAPLGGVVNIDQPFDTAAFRDRIMGLADRLRGDDFDAAFAEFLTTEGPELVPDQRQDLLESNMAPRQDIVLDVWGAVLDTPPDELVVQVEAALPAVGARYLGIFGEPISERERELQALIPDGTVEVWEHHGHFPHLVDPDRVATRISELVDASG